MNSFNAEMRRRREEKNYEQKDIRSSEDTIKRKTRVMDHGRKINYHHLRKLKLIRNSN